MDPYNIALILSRLKQCVAHPNLSGITHTHYMCIIEAYQVGVHREQLSNNITLLPTASASLNNFFYCVVAAAYTVACHTGHGCNPLQAVQGEQTCM